MKVLHISAGSLTGGAARGALWLHEGIRAEEIDSRFLGTYSEQSPQACDRFHPRNISGKIQGYLHSRFDKVFFAINQKQNSEHFLSSGLIGSGLLSHPWYHWADVIHLHWINRGAVSIAEIAQIEKPVVWTVRDMWPFTALCHYTLECEHYKTGCKTCPALRTVPSKSLSSKIFQSKAKHYHSNHKWVAISHWLAEMAAQSPLAPHSISVIHNAIDANRFFPIEQIAARKKLGWPANQKIVLTGSMGLQDKWKGHDLLESAFKNQTTFKLAVFGNTDKLSAESHALISFDLGVLNTEQLKVAYSAADVFVAPSRQEAFGKTIAEAMACATPAVAFNATGPKDLIDHQQTGYLAKPFDVTNLSSGIQWALENNAQNVLGKKGRQKIVEQFSPGRIARHYIKLYHELMNS